MDHGKKYGKLARHSAHRMSMLNNMVRSILLNGKIVTTITKAKALRPYLEKEFVTPIKNNGNSLAVSRQIRSALKSDEAVSKLFEIAKGFENRNGGYSRIIKLGRRQSDQSEMALIEFVQ